MQHRTAPPPEQPLQNPFVHTAAMQNHFLHIVALAATDNSKAPAILQMQHSLAERRRAEGIFAAAGANRVEAERRKDVPSTHLPSIIIAAQPARSVAVFCFQNVPHRRLGLPRLGSIVI